MGFVYARRLPGSPGDIRMFPLVRPARLPDLSRKERRRRVLHHIARIRRNPLARAAVPAHLKMIPVAVGDGIGGHFQFPDVGSGPSEHLELRQPAPHAEIPDKPHGRRVRRPFAERPAAGGPVQPEIMVGVRPFGKSPAAGQFHGTGEGAARASFYRVSVRRKISVIQQ